MKIFKYLKPFIFTPFIILSQSVEAQVSMPNSNTKIASLVKPAVVRVLNICYGEFIDKENDIYQDFDLSFVGTGFFVSSEGHVITSARISENSSKEDCSERLAKNIYRTLNRKYYEGILNKQYSKDSIKQNLETEKSFIYTKKVMLPNSKIEPFDIKILKKGTLNEYSSSALGDDVAIIKIPGVRNNPSLKIADSDEISIQDEVIAVGYPTNVDIKDITQQYDKNSFYDASVQVGRIASTEKELLDGYPVLQVDIQAKRGSGGSPLVNKHGEVIGMISSSNDYWFLNNDDTLPLGIHTSTINEYTNVVNTSNLYPGRTDKLYGEALNLIEQKKYDEAEKMLLRVQRLFKVNEISAHSEVAKLLEDIELARTEWFFNPLKNPYVQILLVVFVGSGLVSAFVYFSVWEKIANKPKANKGKETPTKNGTLFPPATIFIELEFQGTTLYKSLVNSEHRLGRNPNWADLKVPESWLVVSNKHAILKKDGDDYCIYDGDGDKLSTNGIWENDDKRVDPIKGHILRNGDTLKIGQIKDEQVTLTYFNPKNEKDRKKTTRMANLDNRENDKN